MLDSIRDFEWRSIFSRKNADVEQGISSGVRKFKTTDEEVQRNSIVRGVQLFMLFISLFITIAIAAFQKSNKVGPSALTVINLIVIVQCIIHSAALLAIPLLQDRFKGVYRSINQVRFGFVVATTQCVLLFLFALINTISANVGGCKRAEKDHHANQEGYTAKLPGFCRNKRALTAFLYLSLISWLVSLFFVFQQWRDYRKGSGAIPPFQEPSNEEDDVFDANYDAPEMTGVGGYSAPGRASGTFYGSDRPFDGAAGYGSPGDAVSLSRANPFSDSNRPTPPSYEDPYDRIRAEMAEQR